MIDIKQAVKEPVHFVYYRDSQLWYKEVGGTVFPVPIEDIGNATFNATDKGLLFMRYMRKFNKSIEQ